MESKGGEGQGGQLWVTRSQSEGTPWVSISREKCYAIILVNVASKATTVVFVATRVNIRKKISQYLMATFVKRSWQ